MYISRFHYSDTDINIYFQKKTTVAETVSVGLHQINLPFCVLVSSLLGYIKNVSKNPNKYSRGVNKSRSPPNQPQCLCTRQGPIGRHKDWVQVSIVSSFFFC